MKIIKMHAIAQICFLIDLFILHRRRIAGAAPAVPEAAPNADANRALVRALGAPTSDDRARSRGPHEENEDDRIS